MIFGPYGASTSGLGIAGLLNYNMGLFAEGLSSDIGLSRTGFGAALFGVTVSLAVGVPLVGRAVDRFGTRLTAAFGAVALACGFVALASVQSLAAFFAVMILTGLFASSSAPVPHTRAVAGAFDRSRGLALGLTQVGIGLAAAVVPPVVAVLVADHGWRSGAVFLAGLAATALVPVLWAFPAREVAPVDQPDQGAAAFAAVRKSPAFRLQLAAFTSMALSFAGLLSHFVPLLREAGISIERAGAMAGLIGLSVIVTRIVVGWLADRKNPAWLGAASCVLCAGGCLTLGVGGAEYAPLAACALGAAMGAEADLLGIMTARNFPLAAYSRAYAVQYAAFGLAGGLSPLWIGFVADATGGYDTALLICAAALAMPIVLFWWAARSVRD